MCVSFACPPRYKASPCISLKSISRYSHLTALTRVPSASTPASQYQQHDTNRPSFQETRRSKALCAPRSLSRPASRTSLPPLRGVVFWLRQSEEPPAQQLPSPRSQPLRGGESASTLVKYLPWMIIHKEYMRCGRAPGP